MRPRGLRKHPERPPGRPRVLLERSGGELWVSLTKFMFGESLVLKTGLPWVLFAQLDDAMIYHVMPPGSGFYRTGYFERVKEPCARVPMSRVFNIEDRSLLRVFLKHHEDTPETV